MTRSSSPEEGVFVDAKTHARLSLPPKAAQLPTGGGDAIRAYVRSYWGKTEFADVEVHAADGRIFHLHRLVLSQCEFFRLAFSRDFNEAQTRTIGLPDDDSLAIEVMLLWLYGHEYQNCISSIDGFTESTCLEICIVSDKYDIPKLEKVASRQFSWYVPRLLRANKKSLLGELLQRLVQGPEKLLVRSMTLAMLKDNSTKLLDDPNSAREIFAKCPEVASELILHAGLGRIKKTGKPTTKPVVPAKRRAEEE